jgi:hypothetical protein
VLRQLLRRRRLTATAAASAIFAVGLLAPIAISVPAAQAASAPNGWSSISICWNVGQGACIWTDGTEYSNLENRPYSAGGAGQTWTAHYAECDHVADPCDPFPIGSGLNSALAGDAIVTIENDAYGYCIDGNTEIPPELGPCSGGNNEVFVMEPNGDGHWSLIDVSPTSDDAGSLWELQGVYTTTEATMPPDINCNANGCGEYENWAAHSAS